jgi:putative ABC transport system permease protein
MAAKRLLVNRWLSLATTVGLVTSIAFVVSIPLYADAVYYRILWEELSAVAFQQNDATDSLPLTFVFRYVGAWEEPLEWEDIQSVDEYLSGPAAAQLGLPRKTLWRHFKTDTFQLFPQDEAVYEDVTEGLAWVSFGFSDGIEQHITILEGSLPRVASPSPDSVVEVLVREKLALDLGLQVGEPYIAFATRDTQGGKRTETIPVRIAGVWKANDDLEEYWVYNSVSEALLVTEETYRGRISSYMKEDIDFAQWGMVMDGSDIRTDDVVPLLARMASVQKRAAAFLPETRLAVSPMDALQDYRDSAGLLTMLLYAFSVPIIGLTLAFIGLVAGLSVGRRRSEIATLRSRGATVIQVAGIAALEGLLLGAIALAIGLPVSETVAWVMGKARSFMDFSVESNLRVSTTADTLRFGVVAVGLVLATQILPTIGAARHTIVTYKQERARSLRPPWWQRAWLDVLLLIPTVYGTYMLRQQGSIALPMAGDGATSNPLQNPLLLLVPALGVFALTLVILRLLPAVMTGIAWIASRAGSVGLLLAARHLARTPGLYSAPLVLLILTLSLSAFTASLAKTLDEHLYDRMYYSVGADMRLAEFGEMEEAPRPTEEDGGQERGISYMQKERPRWFFVPVSEHLKVPGVQAAARVGQYEALSRLSGVSADVTVMGVDRIDFQNVTFWRRDFASASLGELMNSLAVAPNGVLASRLFMRSNSLKVGDAVPVQMKIRAHRPELDFEIVGSFDLYPTWYPDYSEQPMGGGEGLLDRLSLDTIRKLDFRTLVLMAPTAEDRFRDRARGERAEPPLLVGNLEYIFEQAGGQLPYDVWLRTDPNVDHEQLVEGMKELDLRVSNWDAVLPQVVEEQRSPERQGLFGLLSIGFLASALLTVLGFLLYALFSFRSRFIELGTLRAIGLSSGQMIAFLAGELAFLISIGLAAGTGLGVGISKLFIPYMQMGAEPSELVPPFMVEIAWPDIFRIYALFGLLFVVALVILAVLLMRMKIFQAIKLGETV